MSANDEPLSETDARKFIASEVHRLVIRYTLAGLTILGIANAVAVFTLWHQVTAATKTATEENVKTEVAKYIHDNERQLAYVLDLVKQRAQDLDRENFKLTQQTATQTANLEILNKDNARLRKDADALRQNMDVLNSADSQNAANILRTIQQCPDAKELLAQFRELNARDDAQDQELDWLGQAGSGGVWNALYNYLSVESHCHDAKTKANWHSYADWMDVIAKRAQKRLADSQRKVPTTRPVAVVG